ncbi:hypothetical protein BW737_005450 [Actinomyces ruminis]|uniref:Uncharacterized protein n=1 Tax=Actinomyces ruminis TaxID=1937003 RepID=A0ABX4MC29_9ACTO|nr:hypothetical protein BW737_005450 [Actinomyces ruminis]
MPQTANHSALGLLHGVIVLAVATSCGASPAFGEHARREYQPQSPGGPDRPLLVAGALLGGGVRLGLLVIVALGETVVGIGEPLSEAESVTWQQAVAVLAAFMPVGGLRWSSFHHSSGPVLQLLETARTPFDAVRGVLVYGHLSLIGGIIAVAASFHSALEEPEAPWNGRRRCCCVWAWPPLSPWSCPPGRPWRRRLPICPHQKTSAARLHPHRLLPPLTDAEQCPHPTQTSPR